MPLPEREGVDYYDKHWLRRVSSNFIFLLKLALEYALKIKNRFYTTNPRIYHLLLEKAKYNRDHPTEAERLLWKYLSTNTMGVHFRQQHPVMDYIPDFACLKLKLLIEVDGGYHFEGEQPERDTERTHNLESEGYTIIRFTNEEVLNNIDNTLERIVQSIEELSPQD